MIIPTFVSLILSLLLSPAQAQTRTASDRGAKSTKLPTFVALAPNIRDFGRFADGGPDGSWYVGFNNAWIVELPPAPPNEYARAFIGASLGRAKTRQKPGHPWEREIIPGKIYIGISHGPSFTSEQSFFLAEASDIPLEPDPKTYISGTGQSQWFWAEVPIGAISFSASNYLIVWSPTDSFIDASNSPIIAAAEVRGASGGASHAWLNRSIQGVPPRKEEGSLETPINNLYPSLAIRLIPANDAKVIVNECSIRPVNKHYIFSFSVAAQDADLAWLELSQDQLEWQRTSKFMRQAPYLFNLTQETIPARGAYIRAVAQDMLGNQGSCAPVFIAGTGSNDILP